MIARVVNRSVVAAVLSAVVLLSFGLSGCSSTQSGSSQATPGQAATTGPGGKISLAKKTIGILNISEADPSAAQFQAEAIAAIKVLGWNEVAVDTAGNPTKMAAGMVSLVNQHVDAILDLDVDSPQIAQGLKAAADAHIPVVSYGAWIHDSADLLAQVAPSEYTLESLLDYYAIAALGGFNGNGKVFLLTKTLGIAVPAREALLRMTLKNLAPNISIVGAHSVPDANFSPDVQSAVGAALAANPGINLIWCSRANFSAPAAQAVDQAGLKGKVALVTYYATEQNLDLLRRGEIKAITDFSIAQNSWTAVDELAQYFGKQQKPTWVSQFSSVLPLQYTLITQANVPPAGKPFEYPINARNYFSGKWRQEFSNIQ